MSLIRLCVRFCVLSVALGLVACAGNPSRSSASAPAATGKGAVVVRSADPQDYRFHMEQNGRKMSADEFDAWMKARGIRIATGAPAGQQPAAKAASTGSTRARASK